jgi:hypothetical protein
MLRAGCITLAATLNNNREKIKKQLMRTHNTNVFGDPYGASRVRSEADYEHKYVDRIGYNAAELLNHRVWLRDNPKFRENEFVHPIGQNLLDTHTNANKWNPELFPHRAPIQFY